MSWNSLAHSQRLITLFLRSPSTLYRTTAAGIINTPLQSYCHSKSHDDQPSQTGESDASETSDSSKDSSNNSDESSKQDSRPGVSVKARVNTSTSNSLHRLLITENDRISSQLKHDIEILDKQREKLEVELRKMNVGDADDDWSVDDDEGVGGGGVTVGRKGKTIGRTKRYPGLFVSCGGCGVKLQCNDSSIPGYVPEQLYHQQQQAEKLSELLCRRCDTLQKRNKIIHQQVDEQVYSTVIRKMCKSKSLIVMLVDVTDISNSIIHDVLRNLRMYSSVILVGNKIDLIPMDRRDYKARVMRQLENECINKIPGLDRSILHTCLISAKTGYGVERLIDKLLASYFDYPGTVRLPSGNDNTKMIDVLMQLKPK